MRQRFPTYPVVNARKATRKQKATSDLTRTGRSDRDSGAALHSMKAGIRPVERCKNVQFDNYPFPRGI